MREYFTRLLGNGDTRLRLGRAIENGTLSHAFLISGPEGTGKTVLATELAAAINCESRDAASRPLPCGICNSCRRIREGKFTDLTFVARRKDKATLGVDVIKELREDMFLSATESEHKVYVIDEAEYMTVEAQNALLKVLEEPPKGVTIILLTTECDKILTTIKSRTQLVPMCRFERDELAAHLTGISREAASLKQRDPQSFEEILVGSSGRLGEALRLLDPASAARLGEERGEVMDFVRAISPRSGFAELHTAVSSLSSTKRQELLESLERISSALRDMIALKQASDAPVVFFTSKDEAKALGAEIGLRRLLSVYDAVMEAHDYCVRNGNVSNLLTNLELRLKATK